VDLHHPFLSGLHKRELGNGGKTTKEDVAIRTASPDEPQQQQKQKQQRRSFLPLLSVTME
jgi:hypothetical protein